MTTNGHLPWFAFYPSDWRKDTRMLTLEERGAWFEIITAMWDAPERGRIAGTIDDFSLLLSCSPETAERIISKLERLKVCNASRQECNGIVTLVSRRMVREETAREQTRKRVAKYRSKHSCNGDVTRQKSEVRSQKSEKEGETRAGLLSQNVRDIWNGAEPHKHFRPPTKEEVREYAISKKFTPGYGSFCWKTWTGNNWRHYGQPIVSQEQWQCLLETDMQKQYKT